MQAILSQLGHLFVRTIPTVILVYFLVLILDRLFFKPLTRTLREREEATSGVVKRARELAAETEGRLRAYEDSIREARLENYRLREAARRQSLAEREEALGHARARAEASLKKAQSELAAQIAQIKSELGGPLEALTEMVVTRVLNPPGASSPAEDRRQ
jgi:F-type H+-transporting ATPase subunit b